VFQPDPTLAFVPATRERVVDVIESINQPQISIPGKAPQAAHGHLCGVRSAEGGCTVYVSLYLPQSVENVIYVHEPREVPVAAYREAVAQGLQFLESMGFMLDDLRFRNMAPDLQQRTLERVPLFSRPQAPAAPRSADDRAAASRAALVRFLASF
jgi:hypothetical protein